MQRLRCKCFRAGSKTGKAYFGAKDRFAAGQFTQCHLPCPAA